MSISRNKMLTYLLVSGIALVVCGCVTTQQDWEEAGRHGTVEAYEQFLKKHPDADQSSLAEQRLAELRLERDWEKAKSVDTIGGYKDFLGKYPQSRQASQAKAQLAELQAQEEDWIRTKSLDTVGGYKEFLDKHPQSKLANQARARLQNLEMQKDWEHAKLVDTISSYRDFMQTHPTAPQVPEAEQKLDRLRLGKLVVGSATGVLTEVSFLEDGWDVVAPFRGRLGILAFEKLDGTNTYTMGFWPGKLPEPYLSDVVQAAEVMKAKPAGVWRMSVGSMRPVIVCELTFVDGILREQQWTQSEK